MADEWHITALEDDHCVATWKNVGISIWRRALTRAGLEASLRAYNELARTQGDGLGWLVIVERTSMPPDDEVRKLVGDAMSTKMVEIKALASVQEGFGFHLAAHRAVAASLTATGKIGFPRRVFTTVETATQWLSAELPIRGARPVHPDQLREVIGGLRVRLSENRSMRASEERAADAARQGADEVSLRRGSRS